MSANNDYKLGRVGSGDNIRSVARSSRINALQSLARSHDQGDQYARSGSGLRAIGPGWVVNRRPHRINTTAATNYPWKITIHSSEEEGEYLTVGPGLLNGILPENIFGHFTFSRYDTVYVVLHAETDNYVPTACAIEIRTYPPDPPGHLLNVAPPSFDTVLGITFQGKVYQVATTNLSATPKDIIHTLTVAPAPGRPYYDINYSWLIEEA